jgi:N4-(beta-N-acetylglucosaminyl)-L-asparaginase
MINRRELLIASAALAGAAQSSNAQTGAKNIVISSANGRAACKKAHEMIESGADTLDAVIAGVNIVELDPKDHSVGYGGLPNEDGLVELDSCVTHGPTRRCGAVGALHNIKTPSLVAKAVMEKTDHIFLVGDAATKFARDMGFEETDLLTPESRLIWMAWKAALRDPSGHSNWGPGLDSPPHDKVAQLKLMFPDASEELLAEAWEYVLNPPHGTINCLGLNSKGEMSGVTTTSGLAWKIPGRVGDSPIIGAGLFLDQDVGGAGSTGRGEENIRIAGGHTVVENMRHGMSPKDACLDALKRVARNFDYDKTRLKQVDLDYYALRKDGEYGAASLWGARPTRRGMRAPQFTVNDGGESRWEKSAYLYEWPE